MVCFRCPSVGKLDRSRFGRKAQRRRKRDPDRGGGFRRGRDGECFLAVILMRLKRYCFYSYIKHIELTLSGQKPNADWGSFEGFEE